MVHLGPTHCSQLTITIVPQPPLVYTILKDDEDPSSKGLAQVVKPLVLEVSSFQGPRFNTSWVQTIPWGHIPWRKANNLP